jgi:hypothetical protein
MGGTSRPLHSPAKSYGSFFSQTSYTLFQAVGTYFCKFVRIEVMWEIWMFGNAHGHDFRDGRRGAIPGNGGTLITGGNCQRAQSNPRLEVYFIIGLNARPPPPPHASDQLKEPLVSRLRDRVFKRWHAFDSLQNTARNRLAHSNVCITKK